MIIVKLMGGLGNQMFQYALGRRISLLRNTDLKVDSSFLNDKESNHTNRKFELDVFSLTIPIASEVEMNRFKTIQENKFKKKIQWIAPFIFPYNSILEQGHEFNKSILNSPKNSFLIGYWQTEKYFLTIQDLIRKDFAFKNPLEGVNKIYAKEIKKSNSVSIHIRRGDYIHNTEANQFHGSCSWEYYSTALELVKNKVTNVHLYVFSDDMKWVKDNMNFDIPVTYIDNNIAENSYIDMQLMSLCKHNIIANSSFSWWGAWLNNTPEKIVIAPTQWFKDTSVNINDVIPIGWYKL